MAFFGQSRKEGLYTQSLHRYIIEWNGQFYYFAEIHI